MARLRVKLPLLLAALVLAGCATTPPPPPAPRVAPPPPTPAGLQQIIGKTQAAVIALLGAASLDRSEGPARQLVFIRPPCVLDVFFYPAPGPGGALAVRTAAARKPDGSRIDPGACLALILPTGTPR